jgi:hypothetical protein
VRRAHDHADRARSASGFRFHIQYGAGYLFGTVADRVGDLEKGVLRIRRRLERLDPPPLRPIPLLIAGSGERRTLRLVAQHADIWHTFADGDDLVRKSHILDSHCAEIGRDPEEIERRWRDEHNGRLPTCENR